jgi:VIT1/CCC1 family predicted Fe2+/Mn2+ transporter
MRDDDDDFDWDYIFPVSEPKPLLMAVTAILVSLALIITGAYIGVVYVRHLQEEIHRATPS